MKPQNSDPHLLNLLKSEGYRQVLRRIAESRKDLMGAQRASFQKLADACRVQKSYLSKVFAGAAHFNEDQLFDACEYLRVGAPIGEAIKLQHGIERCSSPNRRRVLQEELEELIDFHSRTERNVADYPQISKDSDFGRYYGDPLVAQVHMFLLVSRFAQNPLQILPLLKISHAHLSQILQTLQELGIATQLHGGAWQVHLDHLHLPRESQHQTAFQSFMRMQALERIMRAGSTSETDFRYAVNFTATPSAKDEIVALFRVYLQSASELIRKSPSEEVYQMVFDLGVLSE